jgi:hypothetical protein
MGWVGQMMLSTSSHTESSTNAWYSMSLTLRAMSVKVFFLKRFEEKDLKHYPLNTEAKSLKRF